MNAHEIGILDKSTLVSPYTSEPIRRTVLKARGAYYAVSETVVLGRPEALVFRCDEQGEVEDFLPVAGGYTYEEALDSLRRFLNELN